MRHLRLPLTLVFFELETFAYLTVNRISSKLKNIPLMTAADEAIPFRHRSLWMYLSFVPFCLLASHDFGGPKRLTRIFSCVSLNALVAYRSFLTSPSSYPRPAIGPLADERLSRSFHSLHAMDRPSNTFPSIHVSHAFLLALMLSHHLPKTQGDAYISWAGAISLSTLLTKQHYLVDITGGLLVAECIARDVYQPWTEGRLSNRQVARTLRALCKQLDDLAKSPDAGRLPLHERHPRIKEWLHAHSASGSFADFYLQSEGRHVLLERKRQLIALLHRLHRPLALANTLMPGWLQFVADFQAADAMLTDGSIHAYLTELDEELQRLLSLVIELPETASATARAAEVAPLPPTVPHAVPIPSPLRAARA